MSNHPPEFAAAERRYLARTAKSRDLFQRAQDVLPAGVGRASIPFFHHPIFIDHVDGAYLHDVDGNAMLDMWNGASSLPLGHRHPAVMAAVQAQLDRGLGFGAPAEAELILAERIKARFPSMERVRFTSSGTEATMFAIRLARGYTGKQLIARMTSSYHGTHDMLMSGGGASLGGTWLGLNDNPVAAGVLPSIRDAVTFLPFNDIAACEAAIERDAASLAALIVEPFMGTGGGFPSQPGFLARLRELCDRHGIVLIFDEMISIGLSRGGGQGHYGVRPDLTATGKLIGGGMPIGAFGGRAEIMDMLIPVDGVPPVLHTGTWNGHPLAMAAGIATLDALDAEAFRYLDHIGDYYRAAVRALVNDLNLAVQVTGVQHFSALHYIDRPVRNPAEAAGSDLAVSRRVHFSLASQGYWMFGGRSNLSTAISESAIDGYIDALAIAFAEARVAAAVPA